MIKRRERYDNVPCVFINLEYLHKMQKEKKQRAHRKLKWLWVGFIF